MQDEEIEENKPNVSFLFGPQVDHSYTREPPTDHPYSREPPSDLAVAPKAAKAESSRSLQFRPILPRPSKANVSSSPDSQTPVSAKSSVLGAEESTSGCDRPVSQIYLVCRKVHDPTSSPRQKALLLPITSVQKAMAIKAPAQKIATSKSTLEKSEAVKIIMQKCASVNTPGRGGIVTRASLLRSAPAPDDENITALKSVDEKHTVTITPVQETNSVKLSEDKPSITITPVSKTASAIQSKALKKSAMSADKIVRYNCPICNLVFLHEVVRRMHMFRKHGVKPHSCRICNAAFEKLKELHDHMKEKHVPKHHMCKICKNVFDYAKELRAHMRENHVMEKREGQETQLKYSCTMCELSFLWYRDLIQHKRSEHNTPRRALMTNTVKVKKEKNVVAGVAVSDKERDMLETFQVKIDGQNWYHCKECMKSWKSFDKAILHIRTHTKDRMYSCTTCDQKFNTPGVLQRHQQVHAGKKPFACDYCDKSFSSKQNRDDHHRFHTKEVKTVCESCGEFLTSASMLYYHRKIHSGITPYVCPYCNKAYAIRALLKRHVRFHTGEKPHLCSVCGRRFNTSGQLKGHSLVHTDIRPFSCEKCGTKMKSTKYLNRHKAICQVPKK